MAKKKVKSYKKGGFSDPVGRMKKFKDGGSKKQKEYKPFTRGSYGPYSGDSIFNPYMGMEAVEDYNERIRLSDAKDEAKARKSQKRLFSPVTKMKKGGKLKKAKKRKY